MHIHLSWNSDRVAACCISNPHKTAVVRRPVRMYTEFSGHALTVKTYRGAAKFVRRGLDGEDHFFGQRRRLEE